MQNEDESQAKALLDAVSDRTIFGYTLKNIILDGKPFDFEGHNYLIEIYKDRHPFIVMEKGAQMGASIVSITRAFYVCDVMGMNVIYFFPTDQDVSEFSKGRVAPIIDESPHLKSIVDKQDAIGLRQVGRGFLYFRGMRSSIRTKSVPADFIVFDELDEVTDDQESQADQRINHSSLRWRMKLSTPTFDGYGIDRDFQRSTMKYWNLICTHCDELNILEETFPDCIFRDSESKAHLVCYKCKSDLNTQYGVWIPKHPERDRIQGYHICGLYSIYADLATIQDDYNEGRRLAELYRSKLGKPYTPADQRLTMESLEQCIDPNVEFNSRSTTPTYMGVDQKGNELHIVIRKREMFTNKPQIIYIGKVREFEELDYYMQVHNVSLCVIDGTPNQHSARHFAARNSGKVYLCYYSETQSGDNSWTDPKLNAASENREWKVSVNRTEQLDGMVEQVLRKEVAFPNRNERSEAALKEFFFKHKQMARVSEEDDDGILKRTYWKKLGADHYAHANTYSYIAMNRYGAGTVKAMTLMPPSGARLLYSRNYEGNSQF